VKVVERPCYKSTEYVCKVKIILDVKYSATTGGIYGSTGFLFYLSSEEWKKKSPLEIVRVTLTVSISIFVPISYQRLFHNLIIKGYLIETLPQRIQYTLDSSMLF
jgi:hypothetical protein